jgi:hypothetical protein
MKFTSHDKIRLAIFHYTATDFSQCQPVCLVCGSNQIVVSCAGKDHPHCPSPALCGEDYSILLYGRNAYSGMFHPNSSFTLDICPRFRQRQAAPRSIAPTAPMALDRYVIHPLIVIVVDCFAAKEANRETVHSSMNAFFQQNNLIPGLGVLPFELRGTSVSILMSKIDHLGSVLSVLFSEAPAWQSAPIIVLWNIHFDGINFFRMGGPDPADASQLRSLIHHLHETLTRRRTDTAVKYFLNTCGVGRETVEAIAQPPDLPHLHLDITSFESVVLVDRLFSILMAYLRCEVFDLFGFKGKNNTLASFSTVFKRCFSEMDIRQFQPICAETINKKLAIWAPADCFFLPMDSLSRDAPSGIPITLKRPRPTAQPSPPSPSLNLRTAGSSISSSSSSSDSVIEEDSSEAASILESQADSAEDSQGEAPGAKRQRMSKARITLGQMLNLVAQSGKPHKSRARIALEHLRIAGIHPPLAGQPELDHSTTVASLLIRINKYRELRQLPLLTSIYKK